MGDDAIVAGSDHPAPHRNTTGWDRGTGSDAAQEIRRREFLVGPDTFQSERFTGQQFIWLWNAGRRVGWVHQDLSGQWELVAFQSCRSWLTGDYGRTVLAAVVAVWGLAITEPVGRRRPGGDLR